MLLLLTKGSKTAPKIMAMSHALQSGVEGRIIYHSVPLNRTRRVSVEEMPTYAASFYCVEFKTHLHPIY